MNMQRHFHAGRWVLSACALTLSLLASGAARAGVIEGCDPRVMAAMQAVAEARVATAVAVNDAIYTMDDSVLALTCFNKASTVAAQQAGKIFSGDFTNVLAPVINDALTAMYANYADNSLGGKSGSVDYSTGPGSAAQMPTGADTSFNCDQVASLWDTVSSQGIKDGLPTIDFELLTSGSSFLNASIDSEADDSFKASVKAPSTRHALDRAKSSIENLKTAAQPNFSGTNSPCEVLKRAKVIDDSATCEQ